MSRINIGDLVINDGGPNGMGLSAGPDEGVVTEVREIRGNPEIRVEGRNGWYDGRRYSVKSKSGEFKKEVKPNPHDDQFPAADGWVVAVKPNIQIHRMLCCGLLEIHGIQGAYTRYHNSAQSMTSDQIYATDKDLVEAIFKAMASAQGGRNRAFWIFTDNSEKETRGAKLAAFINAEGLGPVTSTGYAKNHNSGNMVQAYIWQPNHTALNKWMKANA